MGLDKIIQELRRLYEEKHSGTLFITTGENHAVRFVIKDGSIASITYRTKHGLDAIPFIKKITDGTYTFASNHIFLSSTGSGTVSMPSTSEIFRLLRVTPDVSTRPVLSQPAVSPQPVVPARPAVYPPTAAPKITPVSGALAVPPMSWPSKPCCISTRARSRRGSCARTAKWRYSVPMDDGRNRRSVSWSNHSGWTRDAGRFRSAPERFQPARFDVHQQYTRVFPLAVPPRPGSPRHKKWFERPDSPSRPPDAWPVEPAHRQRDPYLRRLWDFPSLDKEGWFETAVPQAVWNADITPNPPVPPPVATDPGGPGAVPATTVPAGAGWAGRPCPAIA